MKERLLSLALWVALFCLAVWQFDGLGAGLSAPIAHGPDEDWDWQLSLWEAGLRAVQAGEIPGWTPFTGGGLPLWAHPEAPFLYPPWWLSLVFGTELTMKLLILGHMGLLLGGAAALGRELGLGPLSAQLAGAFVLGSAFLPEFIAYGHLMFAAVGWLPVAVVALRRGRWALAGVALAMPLWAGGHYLALYGVLWAVLDTAGRSLRPERARVLCAVLVVNGLALGAEALAWPLGIALVAALVWQRFGSALPWRTLAAALLVAGLLSLPKVLPMLALWGHSGRLAAEPSFSVADPYTPLDAARVLAGLAARPSGHEGPNVFFSWAPPLFGLAGLALAGWRRPAWGLAGWTFWCLGWGGATPLNLLEIVHRLPPWDLLRVIERYSLIWTLFLGWGAGFLLWELGRRSRALAFGLALLLGAGAPEAARQAANLQRTGAGPNPAIAAGPFAQVRDETSNYHGLLANHGRPDRTTGWAPPPPAPGLRVASDAGYRGEAWLLESGAPLPVAFTPNGARVEVPVAGTVVINQNAWAGWESDGGSASAHEGLLAARATPGTLRLRYVVPWLGESVALSLIGLGALALFAGRRRTSESTPPSSHS